MRFKKRRFFGNENQIAHAKKIHKNGQNIEYFAFKSV